MYVDPTGLWNEESRWYKPWTWLNAPNSEENTLGQLAIDIQWQMINSGDSSQYIASFQGATGIKETGIINDETAELLDTYGQWYLMNNNLTLSDYILAKWKQTDEQLFWRLTNSEYQRLKLIDDLYTIYSIYSLASLGFDAYKEIAVARQVHLGSRVNPQTKLNLANNRMNLQLFSEAETQTPRKVIGHYPEYVDLSKKMGVEPFSIPDKIWSEMTPLEQWTANRKFLDRAMVRGSEFYLATPLDKIRPGSFLEKEVEYLISKGYRINNYGTKLVK